MLTHKTLYFTEMLDKFLIRRVRMMRPTSSFAAAGSRYMCKEFIGQACNYGGFQGLDPCPIPRMHVIADLLRKSTYSDHLT